MGQQADSGRNASLDDKKERSAGRGARTGQRAPGREQLLNMTVANPGKGKAGGAFGRNGKANRTGTTVGSKGGGGGGGEPMPAKSSDFNTGTSKRRARKRGS